MSSSSKIANEIQRLMRDPDALRAERDGMQRSGGRGHYDPNQPRVPAGDPTGGQFASKGYRADIQTAMRSSQSKSDLSWRIIRYHLVGPTRVILDMLVEVLV